MRGHIRKRGSTYSIVIDQGRDQEGHRKQKWFSGYKTKKEAEKALNDLITQMEKGDYIEPTKQTVSQYMKYWLEAYAKELSPKTYKRYKELVELHIEPEIGHFKLDKLKPVQIQEIYTKASNEKKLSPASVIYIHRVLHKALKQAVKWQMIVRNPAEAVDPPKQKKKQMNVLDAKGLEKLLNQIKDKKIFMPVYLAVTTGMRRGEICGLKWSDIDLQKGVVYVQRALQRIDGVLQDKNTKTEKSARVIALSNATINDLKKYKKKQEWEIQTSDEGFYDNKDYVCAWGDGKPFDPDWVSHRFAKEVGNLKYKVRFHDLRHTHATLLLKEGVHPKIVSERLGHSEIRITMDTYSHVMPQMQKQAANKLDKILNKSKKAR